MNNVDDHEKTENASLELRNLKVISALGRGAKGVVFLVRTEDIELLALKTILRASIERKNNANKKSGYKRIWLERDVLSSFQHPLLPKLKGVLSTEKIVGYALDYCPGGDLNSLRKKQTEKMFSDDTIRFYAVELVLALEHLHGSGIVYRDLKPENVMIQENGHIMLIDFDLSTKLSPKTPETRQIKTANPPKLYEQTALKSKKKNWFFLLNKCCNSEISPDDSVHSARLTPYSEFDCIDKSNSFVGTEEYLAPEIILGNGHDFSVDWWCLGVVLYEMLYGTTPFRGSNRKETYYRILSKAPDLIGEATPLRDLIKKLLEKDPKQRISLDEIKGHNFFKSVDWDFVVHLPRPPFIPVPSDIADQAENREIDIESFVEGVFEVEEEEDDGRCKNNSQANHGDELMKANHGDELMNIKTKGCGLKEYLDNPNFFVF
ncbi:Serine/threonine-protein kinase OXI1 [Capsicum annuum]|uniref:non-specific serine/threonine protein kinase n=1 Tax=Capsicum annuum TaxID=4072 RepID=A0A1U8DZ82_CAPAN|nr:serine/threonine-protein kinase OXI1 [Capsicum annuum]KAF3624527.1 Serine/threonine-protein kinase OXI1 [Capsicum annuum]KAF3625840.1 Serine/threonine-protein kinase OXI1 [Capsicum annuum]PHT94777.1 Serine/threonine-protein kinase OXI1 [Capsicum annuum]